MVGAHGLALVADILDVIPRACELCQTHRQKVTELRVRAVIDIVVAPHGQEFTVFVRCHLDMHVTGRALTGVSDRLVHVVDKRAGAAVKRQAGYAQERFHRR